MTRKRKNKNIIMSREAHRILELRVRGLLPHNPVIVEDKLFITTAGEEPDESEREEI